MKQTAANAQTLLKIAELEARMQATADVQGLTVDDIRQTIHQVADMVVQISETLPAILEELKALAAIIATLTKESPAAASKKVPDAKRSKTAKK